MAVVTPNDHTDYTDITTTALKHVTDTDTANIRSGRVWVGVNGRYGGPSRIIAGVTIVLVVVGNAVFKTIVVGIAVVVVAAMIRGHFASDEVGVVFAVLVYDEVDEVPNGRVEEDGAHHQVERAEVPAIETQTDR